MNIHYIDAGSLPPEEAVALVSERIAAWSTEKQDDKDNVMIDTIEDD